MTMKLPRKALHGDLRITRLPGLVQQLRDAGISPEDVSHAIITHAHFDHYSGTTRLDRDGQYVPTFPRARYYLSRRDWAYPEIQTALQDSNSKPGRTIGVLHRLGLLELAEGRHELLPGVSIIAAPGDSHGLQKTRTG